MRRKIRAASICFILWGVLVSPVMATTVSLEEATIQALLSNPTIVKAKEDLIVTAAKVQEAWGLVLPTIAVEGSRTDLDSFQNKQVAEAFSSFGSSSSFVQDKVYSAKISVRQTLFGMHIFPAIQGAGFAYESAKGYFDYVQQNMVFHVIEAYYSVLKMEGLSRLASENVTVFQAHLQHVSERRRLGGIKQSDLLAVEVQLNKALKTKLDADRGYQASFQKLKALMGVSVTKPMSLVFDPLMVQKHEHTDINSYLQLALKHRPDYHSLVKTNTLLKLNVEAVSAHQWPFIYLHGSYGFQGTNTDIFHQANEDWQWTLSAQWTLFDGFKTPASIQQEKSRLRKSELEQQELEQALHIEIMDLLLSIQTNDQNKQLSMKAVELAKEHFNEVEQAYKEGAVSNQDVLDAALFLTQAKSDKISAQYDAIITHYRLMKATGTLSI